jgi:hypothetical protein
MGETTDTHQMAHGIAAHRASDDPSRSRPDVLRSVDLTSAALRISGRCDSPSPLGGPFIEACRSYGWPSARPWSPSSLGRPLIEAVVGGPAVDLASEVAVPAVAALHRGRSLSMSRVGSGCRRPAGTASVGLATNTAHGRRSLRDGALRPGAVTSENRARATVAPRRDALCRGHLPAIVTTAVRFRRRPQPDGPSSRREDPSRAGGRGRVAVPGGTPIHRGFVVIDQAPNVLAGRRPWRDGPSSSRK